MTGRDGDILGSLLRLLLVVAGSLWATHYLIESTTYPWPMRAWLMVVLTPLMTYAISDRAARWMTTPLGSPRPPKEPTR